jgi:hypothetical protein
MTKIRDVNKLIDELEPSVRTAFRKAVKNITSNVRLGQLIEAIKNNNLEAAITIINIDIAYFRPLEEALRISHLAAADSTFNSVQAMGARKGVQITGGFDSRNFEAEQVLSFWSSEQVVYITDSTRLAVRQRLTAAMERGTAPRTVALDLVGRLNKAGVRSGGVVGLDPTKAQWVSNMRDDLRDHNPRYFTRELRDRRQDPMVRRMFAEGRDISENKIASITRLYTGKMQRLRGNAISRTELLGSLHAAQNESLKQLENSGQIASDAVTGEWDSSKDKFTRHTHAAVNGDKRQRGVPFTVGGYPMLYPGDGSLGAPVEELVQCRCHLRIDVNFVKGLAGRLTPSELAAARGAM